MHISTYGTTKNVNTMGKAVSFSKIALAANTIHKNRTKPMSTILEHQAPSSKVFNNTTIATIEAKPRPCACGALCSLEKYKLS